jgi:ATP-dependent Clp protease protease subunit
MKKIMSDCENCMMKFKPRKYDSSYVFLAKDRIIFLKENITKEVAAELSALFLYYDSVSQEEIISLYIHCNGGDADGLSNIYDVMQMIKAPIQTVCIGKAYSAAAVLLAAGTKGLRYAFQNSKVMIHGIQLAFPIPGHDQSNSKNYLDFINKNNDNIMKILAKHTGHTLAKIKEDSKRDFWLNAKQAVQYGVIDEVI